MFKSKKKIKKYYRITSECPHGELNEMERAYIPYFDNLYDRLYHLLGLIQHLHCQIHQPYQQYQSHSLYYQKKSPLLSWVLQKDNDNGYPLFYTTPTLQLTYYYNDNTMPEKIRFTDTESLMRQQTNWIKLQQLLVGYNDAYEIKTNYLKQYTKKKFKSIVHYMQYDNG